MICRGCAVLVVCVCAGSVAFADVVRLKTGGELRGKVVKTGASVATGEVALETLTGATVVVPRSDVDLVIHRTPALEEYETRLRGLPDTAEVHRQLADWCKSKNLLEQRKQQLLRVVELVPDDEPAHLALGHVWKDGRWVDLDEYWTARGYVKHKGHYITQQEYELRQKSDAEVKREQEWYSKVRLWSGWLTGPDAERAQNAAAALRSIQDDDAAPAVLRFLGEHAAREARMLGVEVLTHAAGPKSAKALVRMTLRDHDPEVRYTALEGIGPDQFAVAQPMFLKELRNEANPIVCRAGQALTRVGDDRAIPQLIEALITSHQYEVRLPGSANPTYSFGTDGSFGGAQSGSLPPGIEAGLRTGQFPNGVIVINSNPAAQLQTRTVMVRMDQQNVEVLGALQKITGQDYGYDERLWRLWWATKKAAG